MLDQNPLRRGHLAPPARTLVDVLEATTGRTVLLVTHRMACLDAVDEVVVLDRGRVVQRGTAQELRRAPGLFRELERAEQAADALLQMGT